MIVELHPDVHLFLENYYGKEELDRMLQALTSPPTYTCIRVNTLKITRELLITLLSEQLKKEYQLVPHPTIPDVILIPATGPNDVPNIYPQIVVDAKCGQAVLMGSDIFVPGVMGAESNRDMVSVIVDVDGKVLKGDHRRLEGSRSFFIGNGIVQMSRSVLFRGANGTAVQMKNRIWEHPPLNSVLPDLMFLQHLPSVVVAHQLNPQQNSLVLDMCAAPGGKTLHIATLMKDKGRIFAFDKSKSKVKHIQDLAAKHGITCITAMHKDSTKLLQIPHLHGLGDTNSLHEVFTAGSFDYILLDPPCSGLGQRPRLKEDISLVDVASASKYQQKLLHVAYELLKPGGTLVYSTCTINPEENEGNVSYALSSFPKLQLVKQEEPYIGQPGIDAFGLTNTQRECLQRFPPTLNTIGFFIAKFIKLHS